MVNDDASLPLDCSAVLYGCTSPGADGRICLVSSRGRNQDHCFIVSVVVRWSDRRKQADDGVCRHCMTVKRTGVLYNWPITMLLSANQTTFTQRITAASCVRLNYVKQLARATGQIILTKGRIAVLSFITGCAVAPALCQRRLALSMGKGNFRPPTESTPLNRSQKSCHR